MLCELNFLGESWSVTRLKVCSEIATKWVNFTDDSVFNTWKINNFINLIMISELN